MTQALQWKSRQVPCPDCIERASKAYTNAKSTPPGLCLACRATLTRIEAPKIKEQLLGDRCVALDKTAQTLAADPSAQATMQPPSSRSLASLTSLTRRFVTVVNDRDFVSPIWYKASAGIAVDALDNFTPTTTLAENIRTFQTITKESPQYRLHVVSIDILESQDGALAESYINMRVTGRPEGLVMNSVGRMQWRRCQDDWVLMSFTAMRFSDLS